MADDSGHRRDVEHGLPSQRDGDLGARLDHLTVRVEAMAGLVESLFDRLELSRATPMDAPITAEELADIAARMVRLIEVRLESHSERLEQVIGAIGTGQLDLRDLGTASEGDSAAVLQQLDARLTETGAALAQKVEDQLAVRVQRFEALSQAMMTMVGDPVDALGSKLTEVLQLLRQLVDQNER